MKPMVGKLALSAFLTDDSITGNHGVLEIHGELCNARCVVALGQSATTAHQPIKRPRRWKWTGTS